MKKDIYYDLCCMFEYPNSKDLRKLWMLLVPDETEAKVLTVFRGKRYPHDERKTTKEAAQHANISEDAAYEYLTSLLKKGIIAKVGEDRWVFSPYADGSIEGTTDGMIYSIAMHYYDPETKKLTDPSKQAILDAVTDFCEHDWYRFKRVDELLHARQLGVVGDRPLLIPNITALEKSNIKPEDYPNTFDWSLECQAHNAKSINMMPCPCRFRCGELDLPLMTCVTMDFGNDPEETFSLDTEVEIGNRVRVSPEEYLEYQKKGERAGLLHASEFCSCEEKCCNQLAPLDKYATIKEGVDPSAFRARMKDVDKCVGCGICEKYCRFDAIEISNGKCIVTQSECYGCGSCVTMCPVDALELYYVGESDDE